MSDAPNTIELIGNGLGQFYRRHKGESVAMDVSDKIKALVNESPALQSALYDMNLLPEQICTKAQADALTYFAGGFVLGQKHKTVDASKERDS